MEQENIDPNKEKFIGWFWCPYRKDYFRWSSIVDYNESKRVEDEDSSV